MWKYQKQHDYFLIINLMEGTKTKNVNYYILFRSFVGEIPNLKDFHGGFPSFTRSCLMEVSSKLFSAKIHFCAVPKGIFKTWKRQKTKFKVPFKKKLKAPLAELIVSDELEPTKFGGGIMPKSFLWSRTVENEDDLFYIENSIIGVVRWRCVI